MIIRKSTKEDFPVIMETYDIARGYMRKNGNYNQWINGYPQKELILKDIESGCSYVCMEDGEIAGTFYFYEGEDLCYREIEGTWSSDAEYAVIHRIGSTGKVKGILKSSVEFCGKKAKYLRMDTHRDNIPMQAALKKIGFRECGIIHIEDGTERIAFDLVWD